MRISIETTRLKLVPLPYEDLCVYTRDRRELEKKWGLQLTNETMDPAIQKEVNEAMGFWLKFVKENPQRYAWYSPWQIILKGENRIIGSLGFDSHPSLKKEITVGYMIDTPFHNQGFATEALKAVLGWAFQEENDFKVLAETPKDHLASQKVLMKCGFVKRRETEFSFMWDIRD